MTGHPTNFSKYISMRSLLYIDIKSLRSLNVIFIVISVIITNLFLVRIKIKFFNKAKVMYNKFKMAGISYNLGMCGYQLLYW